VILDDLGVVAVPLPPVPAPPLADAEARPTGT
jgi:hypothetical protein